jgi:hypothetical protein
MLLTSELLDAWLERWRSLGVPYVDAWQPGLSESDLAEAPIDLPPELRTWWGWRNGTRNVERNGRSGSVWMAPGLIALPLDAALARTDALRERVAAAEAHVGGSATSWLSHEQWIVLAVGATNVVASLEPSADGASAVRVVGADELLEPPRPAAPSLGTLVQWWIDAIDTEMYWWDDEDDYWGSTTPPFEQRTTGLV